MILVNARETTTVEALDRGLHYGDGLFETLAVIDGRPLHWHQHMQRLQSGCQRLKFPDLDLNLLATEARSVCQNSKKSVLKIIITRGISTRGYRAPQPCSITRVVMLLPYPDFPAQHWTTGINSRICNTRLGHQPMLAGIKHLNRLEQVLARGEWVDDTIAEGLMLDYADFVIEGTASNVFIVKKGQLLTPDLSSCGIAGVTRARVLDLAKKLNIPARIERISLENLQNADEIFFTNSLINVWPVKQLDIQRFEPGPITKRIASNIEKI